MVVLGSLARREPPPTSDVDTALVWPDDLAEAGQAEYLERAEALLTDLESRAGSRGAPTARTP